MRSSKTKPSIFQGHTLFQIASERRWLTWVVIIDDVKLGLACCLRLSSGSGSASAHWFLLILILAQHLQSQTSKFNFITATAIELVLVCYYLETQPQAQAQELVITNQSTPVNMMKINFKSWELRQDSIKSRVEDWMHFGKNTNFLNSFKLHSHFCNNTITRCAAEAEAEGEAEGCECGTSSWWWPRWIQSSVSAIAKANNLDLDAVSVSRAWVGLGLGAVAPERSEETKLWGGGGGRHAIVCDQWLPPPKKKKKKKQERKKRSFICSECSGATDWSIWILVGIGYSISTAKWRKLEFFWGGETERRKPPTKLDRNQRWSRRDYEYMIILPLIYLYSKNAPL